MSSDPFRGIEERLNPIYGDNVFQHWHTGGGCTAIQGFLEGDITVMITDDPYTERGHEAFITDLYTRHNMGGDHLYGYVVGVYRDEGCYLVTMDRCSTADQLPDLVARLLTEAVRQR